MPAPQIKSIAKKAGISAAKAEKLWSKAKAQAKGSKLKDGSTVPDKESSFKDKDWAYVMGVFKKMAGINESYRVVLNGDEVQLVHRGIICWPGQDSEVDQIREKIQDLLDADVEFVYDIGGFEGSLKEIADQVLTNWILFCGVEPKTHGFYHYARTSQLEERREGLSGQLEDMWNRMERIWSELWDIKAGISAGRIPTVGKYDEKFFQQILDDLGYAAGLTIEASREM